MSSSSGASPLDADFVVGQGGQVPPLTLDICVLVDATASMGPALAEVKAFCASVVSKTRSVKGLKSSRVGIVAYRDYGDGPAECLDFTGSSEAAYAFVASVVAKGGDDTAEDVRGGLKEALRLSWGPDQAAAPGNVKLILHVADAPPHGSAYHDLGASGDRHLSEDTGAGHQTESVRSLIKEASRKGINYCFVKVNGGSRRVRRASKMQCAMPAPSFDRLHGAVVLSCAR